MRIFVAYGYNARDSWIEPTVASLIRAFGSEPVDGRELGGQSIPEGVRQSIRSSDALLAFFTRRDGPLPDGSWTTHQWVRDELTCALEHNKQVLEIYEDGVSRIAGLAGSDRQHLAYQENEQLECVVEIVKVLGQWHRRGTRRFQLLPHEKIRPHLSKPYFVCRYRVMEGNHELPEQVVKVQKIQGGLFIDCTGLSRESLIQVEIVTNTGLLSSDYTSVDAVSVALETIA